MGGHYPVQFQYDAAPPYWVVLPWVVFQEIHLDTLVLFSRVISYEFQGHCRELHVLLSFTNIMSFLGPDSLLIFLFWPSVMPWAEFTAA